MSKDSFASPYPKYQCLCWFAKPVGTNVGKGSLKDMNRCQWAL